MKRRSKLLSVVFLPLLLSATGQTLPLETIYFHKIAKTHSRDSLERLQSQYSELKIVRLACRIQLREHLVPDACYRTLTLETAVGLHPVALERRQLQQHLDSLCQTAAIALKVPSHTPVGLSTECNRQIASARKIQDYRQQSELPEAL